MHVEYGQCINAMLDYGQQMADIKLMQEHKHASEYEAMRPEEKKK